MTARSTYADTIDGPLISVIMANHNGARFVGAAVRSVLDQTVSALELILIDDGSSDASVAEAEAVAGGDPRLVIVVLDRSHGPGGARNEGLSRAKGSWIAIVDSDDLLERDRFEAMLRLAAERDADLVADNLRLFSEAGEGGDHLPEASWREPRRVDLAEFARSNRFYERGANLGFLKPLIARKVLARTGIRYDESLRVGEDYDLVARLLAAGASYWVDPVARYRYRRHASSTSHRLKRADLEALVAADVRFREEHPCLDPVTLNALADRRRSIERAIGYDGAIAALKARAPLRAIAEVLRRPSAAPLLAMPIAARIERATRPLKLGQASPQPFERKGGGSETNRGSSHLALTRGAKASAAVTVESGESV